jgi:hypothetical protein
MGAASQNWGGSGSALVQLSAGNTVEIYIATGSAAKALDVSANTLNTFSGFLVSET